MGSTFTQAKEKTTTAAHTVSDGAAVVRDRAARLARRAVDQTSTALDRAQHQAEATTHTLKGTASEATARTRGAIGTLTARAGRSAPSAGGDMSGRTKTLIGLGAAAAVAVLAWLGLRGRVD
jgi:Flp pilus assembly protein TadB